MYKYLLIALTVILLTGCGNSVNECKQLKYKGIVIRTFPKEPVVRCSNGAINQLNQYSTQDGAYSTESYIYHEFK